MITVEMRLYRRFDGDLLALWELGLPVAKLAKEAVTAYANGRRIRYLLPRAAAYDFSERKGVHLRISITDRKTEAVLRQIKRGYRCQFLKTVLRNSLLEQSLAPFFSDNTYVAAEDMRLRNLRELSEEGVVDGAEIILIEEKKKKSRTDGILRPAGYRQKKKDTGNDAKDTAPRTENKDPLPARFAGFAADDEKSETRQRYPDMSPVGTMQQFSPPVIPPQTSPENTGDEDGNEQDAEAALLDLFNSI